MGLLNFFAMSEEQLKQEADRLDKLQTDLDNQRTQQENRSVDLDHRDKVLQAENAKLEVAKKQLEDQQKKFLASVKVSEAGFAAERQKLLDEQLRLQRLQAEAEGGFAALQKEAVAQTIEPELKKLEERRQELEKMLQDLTSREGQYRRDVANLVRRESAVSAREEEASEGFAGRELAVREKERESAEREKDLNAREASLAESEKVRDEGFANEHEKLQKELSEARVKHAHELANERQEQARKLADARAQAERERAEYDALKTAELEKSLAQIRQSREDELNKAMQNERKRVQSELEKLKQSFEDEQKSAWAKIREMQETLAKERGELTAAQNELVERRAEHESDSKSQKAWLDRERERLGRREQEMDDRVAELAGVRVQNLETEISTLKQQNKRLEDSLKSQSELLGVFEVLKRQLGGKDAAEAVAELNAQGKRIVELEKQLSNRPGPDVGERLVELEKEKDSLQREVGDLRQELDSKKSVDDENAKLRRANAELDADKKSLDQRARIFESAANEAQGEVERLRAAYQRPQVVEDRKKEIEKPLLDFGSVDHAVKPQQLVSEQELIEYEQDWLEGIRRRCEDYGLYFNSRILKSFHTALKTADWAPLTILAGVSGTGKSELPRLYSHFGGLNFVEVAVQPNWDCQESMLGFFNSIDNKFDAQPVLRFLAQTQKKWFAADKADASGKIVESKYPGLYASENMVLLDEMNLAHPELYFAEFLSKLESRRGKQRLEVPCLDVKIGAGLPPYQLPLGRNVLWVGTMNQDETTKSLSDKVLDRSIVIYFPRPTSLKRRLDMKPRNRENQGTPLHRRVWEDWIVRESNFTEEEIGPYKKIVEDINNILGNVGRAIGHRVWQSIEYYMANYPDVREARSAHDDKKAKAAMDIAFEDQLVQKVMPKLRGIDTLGSGNGKKCLDAIRSLLDGCAELKELLPDFDLAMSLGYGQFQWQSAKYLERADQQPEVVAQPDATSLPAGAGPTDESLSAPDGADHEDALERLKEHARTLGKDVWMLTSKEIRDFLGCSPKDALQLKTQCNQLRK